MNKDKITAQDIIDKLSEKEGRSKRITEDFIRAFVASIEDALLKGESVKVKGFGTFKAKWIAPRKSVNVQTGEDIKIEGYYKVDFTPETHLKELVNEPFAHLESVVLDEKKIYVQDNSKDIHEEINPLAVLEEQAFEIKSLLSEIQSMSLENLVSEEKIFEEENQTVEVIIEEKREDIDSNKKTEITPQEKNKIEEPSPVIIKKKKRRVWLWILLLLCLPITLSLVLFFYYLPFNTWVHERILKDNNTTKIQIPKSVIIDEIKATESDSLVFEVEKDDKSDNWDEIFTTRLDNIEYMATEKLGSGSRLALLAEKYYGSPYFWVYIYEANKDIIANPNKIPLGTNIRIPKLNEKLIDLQDSRSIEQALELGNFYLKK